MIFCGKEFEIFIGKRGGIHFAEAQANAVLYGVDANDAQTLDFTFLEDLLGMLDSMIGNLRDMDQAFDIAFQAGERAELGQAGDDTLDQLPDAVFFNP